ncbi:putative nuclease HARBI1 [Heterodontus francisci]|uniref:putative nuclease HARBI1 n=1 Tax=Heterodontus francisci TaxID=7792 RepID=UPI00355BA7B0
MSKQCLRRLKLSRQIFTDICSHLEADLCPREPGGHALPVTVKVTTALKFFMSGSFRGSAGDICRISQPAAYNHITQVTNALFAKVANYIHSDTDDTSQTQRAVCFASIVEFPQVYGVIDCTHMAIIAPSDQPDIFINWKGFHSLMCSWSVTATRTLCRSVPGIQGPAMTPSSFSSLMYTSVLCTTQPQWLTPGMQGVPTDDLAADPREEPYHRGTGEVYRSHVSTRATIEQAISLFKRRFLCLGRFGGTL